MFRTLRAAGLVSTFKHADDGRSAEVEVSPRPAARLLAPPHALALPARHPARGSTRESPTYALDVLTLVESILEDPTIVLRKQLDTLKTKGRRAEGAGASSTTSGWRSSRSSSTRSRTATSSTAPSTPSPPSTRGSRTRTSGRSRSRARCSSGSAPSPTTCASTAASGREGVLLRYLSDVYKTLVQTVPESDRDEALDEALQSLRAHRPPGRLEPPRRVGAPAAPGRSARPAGGDRRPARPITAGDRRADPGRAPPPAQGDRREGLGRRSGLPRARPRLDRRVTARRGRALLHGPRGHRPHPRRPPPEHGHRPL